MARLMVNDAEDKQQGAEEGVALKAMLTPAEAERVHRNKQACIVRRNAVLKQLQQNFAPTISNISSIR